MKRHLIILSSVTSVFCHININTATKFQQYADEKTVRHWSLTKEVMAVDPIATAVFLLY